MSGAPVVRPPMALYEVRTRDGMAYRAEGDVIEQGDGWFTLYASEMVLALRIPEADIRAVRQVDEDEDLEDEAPADAAVARVRALHADDGNGYCAGCGYESATCGEMYRIEDCPTLRALNGDQP